MAADGSMRDALSLMDQALAFGSGALRDQEVADMLGSLEQDFLLELLEALAAGDGPRLVAGVERLAEASADFTEALADLLVILHQLTLANTVPEVISSDGADAERLAALAEQFDPAGIQLLYQIALHGRRDLPLAPDPRAGFEMTMLRMLAFQPDWDAGEQTKAPAPAPAPSSTAKPQPAASSTAITDWHALVPQLGLSGIAQALASHCEWVKHEGDCITLQMNSDDAHLMNEGAKARLTSALCEHFNQQLTLSIHVGSVSAETPAEAAARARSDKQSAAHAAIEADPNIAALKATFDAEVITDSIRPDKQESEQ